MNQSGSGSGGCGGDTTLRAGAKKAIPGRRRPANSASTSATYPRGTVQCNVIYLYNKYDVQHDVQHGITHSLCREKSMCSIVLHGQRAVTCATPLPTIQYDVQYGIARFNTLELTRELWYRTPLQTLNEVTRLGQCNMMVQHDGTICDFPFDMLKKDPPTRAGCTPDTLRTLDNAAIWRTIGCHNMLQHDVTGYDITARCYNMML